ncbi:MAG: glycosyltransferase [Lactobacillales bacterium]|jgi:glycosyltransferase involved in cell wall biosynthesis|nr:glycosyltransferase [Lactobacillales bacterium]
MKKILLLCGIYALATLIGIAAFFAQIHWNTPKVSVVMPTYNRADLLPRAIESILTQTYWNFEFIIVDDGSTDTSAEIIQMYSAIDPRIKYVKNEKNRGISFSRNRGNDLAAGKYIAVMDSDDVALPDRLKKQVAYLQSHREIDVLGTASLTWDTREFFPISGQQDPEINKALFHLGFVPIIHSSAMIRKDFLRKNHITYNETYIAAVDYAFWVDILKKGGQIANHPQVLTLMRLRDTNPEGYYWAQMVNAEKIYKDFVVDTYGKPVRSVDIPVRIADIVQFNAENEKLPPLKLKGALDVLGFIARYFEGNGAD